MQKQTRRFEGLLPNPVNKQCQILLLLPSRLRREFWAICVGPWPLHGGRT